MTRRRLRRNPAPHNARRARRVCKRSIGFRAFCAQTMSVPPRFRRRSRFVVSMATALSVPPMFCSAIAKARASMRFVLFKRQVKLGCGWLSFVAHILRMGLVCLCLFSRSGLKMRRCVSAFRRHHRCATRASMRRRRRIGCVFASSLHVVARTIAISTWSRRMWRVAATRARQMAPAC